MRKIKVLHAFTTLDNGGVESFIYNYYSLMPKEKIQFDFFVLGNQTGFLEKYFIQWGSRIFHVPRVVNNPILHFIKILHLLKLGEYDIIHLHGYKSAYLLPLAKFCGINNRIIHSHMANVEETFWQKKLRKLYSFLINKYSTDKFACGREAAIWLYNKLDRIKLFHNAINLQKFSFSSVSRQKIRNNLNIDDNTLVLGNVSRLSHQKNQQFLIKIMNSIIKVKKNTKLIHIGSGEDRKKVEELIDENGLGQYVELLGVKENIADYLSAMDIFLLPSLYEGLPVILIEVQANGLYSIVSQSVTSEMNEIGRMSFLPIGDNNIDKWVNSILSQNNSNRNSISNSMFGGKYDIETQSKKLFQEYTRMMKGNINAYKK
ncbi:TPA: glycosyltransferase [Streptococcus suis]|uniref:Glycosyltransferase n=1 Tax=Streptococcus suis TaxID=1307 RepID=A0A1P8VRB2_STRSU|nr:Glycosyltransferase [Streptococcus suis]APZ79264.1 Glycosyltransferase [Streptococcus suis]HEM2786808.1 glycosyltransferase [Streptococcus suis]